MTLDETFTRGFAWTDERVETMRAMLGKGASASEVGRAIGCSRCAVLGKAHRMGIENRCHTGGNKYSAGKPLAIRNAPHVPKPRAPRPQKQKSPAPPLSASPEPLRVRLEDRARSQCRWPLWDVEGGPDFFICGLPSGLGSWCPFHARKAFGPGTPSERTAA